MKTNIHSFTLSRPVLLRMRNAADKSWRDIHNTYLMFNKFPSPHKIVPLWDNVEKYFRAVQATNDKMVLVSKVTDTLSEYVVLVFQCNSGCTNVP